MLFRNLPIQKKLMRVNLLISGVVLFVTCGAFFVYEYFSFRRTITQELLTLGQIISTNSKTALAFEDQEDATEILAALRAQRRIISACLYNQDGVVFARYPSNLAVASFTVKPQWEGYRFTAAYLEGLQPVMQGDRRLGTLYLKSDLKAMYERFRLYGIIAVLVMGVSFFLAYLLSRTLQRNISQPILDLVVTSTSISLKSDYSVRVEKQGNDELGLLTDALNHMLGQIQKQNQAMNDFNQNLEQKVRERTHELEVLNRELDSFSYSISHDLRAPLRAINGYMSIFSEDYHNKVDPEGQRLINIVLKNSKKMGRLIDDLLAFSKLGRKEISKTSFSMKSAVLNVWEDLSKMEAGRSIEFTLDELPDAWADAGTIHQVWVNLISNALKYSGNREKTIIHISFEKREKELVYCIKDNGAGFDMEYYNKLFGVFQRLHTQKEFQGTGVGLAIVQRIVERHGGKIWADSKLHEGATFYFSLPVADAV